MNSVNIEFYVNKFCAVNSPKETDISFLPLIMKRRLSNIDKCTLSTLNSIFTDNCQYLVFSSRKGEIERLIKIINQYTKEGEVSPNTFSGSVHNYPAGFFLLNKKTPVPYTAISAGDRTISAGLLGALTSNYENILFCYADSYDDKLFSFGVNITKTCGKDKYKLTLKSSNKKENFNEFTELFSGIRDYTETELFKTERI